MSDHRERRLRIKALSDDQAYLISRPHVEWVCFCAFLGPRGHWAVQLTHLLSSPIAESKWNSLLTGQANQ